MASPRNKTVPRLFSPLVGLALAATGLASCSAGPSPAPSSSGASSTTVAEVSSSPSVTGSATATVDVTAVPATMRPVATALYTGKAVSVTPALANTVKAFTAATGTVSVAGRTGTWKGTPIGVLTLGRDATLLVNRSGKWTVVGGWWPSLGVSKPALGGKQFVLFMGSDARVEKGQNVTQSNADALQLVGVDGAGGGGIMGMARDLWVPINGGGSGKINSGLFGGPQSQTRTVRDATGLPVRSYVLAGFNDFAGTINGIGGVLVDSPMRVKKVPKGKSTLDGRQALWYSRERKSLPEGDFSRSSNQGVVLISIAVQTRAKGPLVLPSVLSQASQHLHSNLTAEQALTFGAWIYQLNPAKVGHQVAKGPFGRSPDGASIVILGSQARAIFTDFRDGNLAR